MRGRNAEDLLLLRSQRVTATNPTITNPTPMNPNCSLMRSRLVQGVPHRVLCVNVTSAQSHTQMSTPR